MKDIKEKHLKALAAEIWLSFTDQEKDLVGGLCIFPAAKMQVMPIDNVDHHFVTCELLKLSKSKGSYDTERSH